MKSVSVVFFAAFLLSSCSTMDRWMGGGSSSSSSGMGGNSDSSSMGGYSSSYRSGMGGDSDRVGGAIANPATNPILSSDPRNIYFGN